MAVKSPAAKTWLCRTHAGTALAVTLCVLGAGLAIRAAEQSLPMVPAPRAELKLQEIPYKIVYETYRKTDGKENWELYIVNADGSNPVNLTRTADVDEMYPHASPDGGKICFVADEMVGGEKIRNVYYMNIDGTGRVKVADNARQPCWSPDGKTIAYLKAEFERYTTKDFATKGIFFYNIETRKHTQHKNKGLHHLYNICWSPDGKWFVATVHGGMGFKHAILAIEADGTGVFDLTKFGVTGCRPDFSGDGKKITWGATDWDLCVANISFAGAPRVTNVRRVVKCRKACEVYHSDFSPDGRYITFSHGPKAEEQVGGKAPGWDICVASIFSPGHRPGYPRRQAGAKRGGGAAGSQPPKWVEITTDGNHNKEPDWVPGFSAPAKGGGLKGDDPQIVNEYNKSLLQAAADGDMDQVKSFLLKGSNVNAKDKFGWTALHIATARGSQDMVELLIGSGGEVDAKDIAGGTPLHLAAELGHEALAGLFIAKGADVNAKRDDGAAPLHLAAWNGRGAIEELLIAKGADVNAKMKNGRTLLHLAAQKGRRDLAEFLIAKGVDVNVKDIAGVTPLHLASIEGQEDLAQLLIAGGAEVNDRTAIGRAPLHFAAEGRQVASAELLVTKGADVNAKDNNGQTPLHIAAALDWWECVELLVARGADVNAQDEGGSTPLMFSVDNADMAGLLIAGGADVNLKSETAGVSALHLAVEQDNSKLVALLLSRGADVNAKASRVNWQGWTPLHIACERGWNETVIEVLLAKGAEVNARTDKGDTPLSLARGHKTIVELLRKHGGRE